MIRDDHNVIPISLAVLLHVVVFGSLIVVLDFAPRTKPITPLAIKGVLVTEAVEVPPVIEAEPEPEPEPIIEEEPETEPEPVIEEEPEVEPEPEPVIEPEPPQPDPAEEARRQAEEQKRLEDARIERERKEREAELERQRQEADRKRREEEELERKRREEEELERKRAEAERKRQEDIRRQREENERRRREEEESVRLAEIEAEEALNAARSSDDMARYMFALQQKVVRNWARPASAKAGLECVVRVRQLQDGQVISANVVSCNGDEAVVRSIEAAVRKASPLPVPANPILFEPDLRFVFKPEQ